MGPLGGAIVDAPDCSNIASEGMSFDLPVSQKMSESVSPYSHSPYVASQAGQAQ